MTPYSTLPPTVLVIMFDALRLLEFIRVTGGGPRATVNFTYGIILTSYSKWCDAVPGTTWRCIRHGCSSGILSQIHIHLVWGKQFDYVQFVWNMPRPVIRLQPHQTNLFHDAASVLSRWVGLAACNNCNATWTVMIVWLVAGATGATLLWQPTPSKAVSATFWTISKALTKKL